MAYIFRANINLKSTAAGIATWCSQQVAQRLNMAFHLNHGNPNEEPSHHETQNNGRKWIADIFVPDSEWAVMDDFFSHLEAIWHHAETIPGEDEMHEISWMDVHYCYNEINQPCGEILRYKATEPPEVPTEPEEPSNACEGVLPWTNTQHWSTYAVGDKRTDGSPKKLYELHDKAWAQSYAPSSAWGYLAWTYLQDCS